MGRHRKPREETIRWELYREYCRYAELTNTLPNPHVFCHQVLPTLGYAVNWATFLDHWRQLQIDGLIRINSRTSAVEIVSGTVKSPLET